MASDHIVLSQQVPASQVQGQIKYIGGFSSAWGFARENTTERKRTRELSMFAKECLWGQSICSKEGVKWTQERDENLWGAWFRECAVTFGTRGGRLSLVSNGGSRNFTWKRQRQPPERRRWVHLRSEYKRCLFSESDNSAGGLKLPPSGRSVNGFVGFSFYAI